MTNPTKVPEAVLEAFWEAQSAAEIDRWHSALTAAIDKYNELLLGADALNAAEVQRKKGMRAGTIVGTAIDSVMKGEGDG